MQKSKFWSRFATDRIHNTAGKEKCGFTLIEALVFLFIFTVSVLSLYQAFNVGMNYIIETKKKLGAVGLANEEIEKKRNLGYENLPAGVTENAEITKNGMKYYVTTNITDFDDDDDGSPDPINWDYKKINVEVKWALGNPNRMIAANAIVVPPVIEKDASKGYMRLHVINQSGSGLAGALVRVIDLTTNAVVYLGNINSNGNLFLTGLDPGKHKITVGSDNNYYPVETKDGTVSFDPADKHVDINVKTLTEKTIQTDIASTLNVSLKNTFGGVISNLGFDIIGGKLLGVENGTDEKYDFSDSVSGSDGTENFSNMSFGPYFFTFTDLNDGTSDYQFLWMNPINDTENKIFLNANETLEAGALLALKSVPSLLVIVEDVAGDPVSSASVHLVSSVPGYDATLTTNEFGKVYFPENSGEITNSGYNITVSAGGFNEESDTVTINNFTQKSITLTDL